VQSCPIYSCDNVPNCKPIQIIFGINIADKIWNKLTHGNFDIYSLSQGFQSGGSTGKAAPSEARRAESGGGVFREGQPAPSPPARRYGDRCELPQRGLGRSPGHPAVFLYFECSGWLLL